MHPQFTQIPLPEEEWRAIQGYEGLYEISSLGRHRSVKHRAKVPYGTVLFQGANHLTGYTMCCLYRAGKPKMLLVHQLVARTFIGPRPNGMDINHIDGSKANNAAANLEYISHLENIRHGLRLGLRRIHFTATEVFAIRADPRPQAVIAAEYGVVPSLISRIKTGKRYRWATS